MGLKTSFDRSELPQDLAAITHFPPVSDHLTPPAQQANSHYTPFLLATRKIILSDETLGEAARFEMLASRYDCIIGSSPYINSLVRIVSRINGIFLAAREGKQASYQLCCYNDFLNESAPPPTTNKGTVGISRLESFGLNEINRDVFNASRCACQMANIETKLLDSGLPSTITPSFILSLHSTLSAIYSPGVSAGLRNHDFSAPRPIQGESIYRPPSPLELPVFLKDLAAFINDSKLSPSIKGALVHYQTEATKMFSSNTEQLNCALLIGLWQNAGLIKRLILPIAVTPALETSKREKVLQSYRFSPLKTEVQMIDDWIYHTARASQNAVQIEYGIFSIIGKIVDKWEALLASSEVHLTKTMRKLLIAIVGAPVFSIASLAHATEASYTTVSNIITLLSSHGIITQVSRGRRNKVYACPEALGLFDTIIAEVA